MQIERRIKGSRRECIAQEWLTNSVHFPLANIILELLLTGVPAYLFEVGIYALIVASLVQAWFLGTWQYRGTPRPLVGNLLGPAIYTLVEMGEKGLAFFEDPYHWAYWLFALVIGLLQQGRLAVRRQTPLILLENVVRTSILIATYWMLELMDQPRYLEPGVFLQDEVHRFLIIVVLLLGLVIGFANAASLRYLEGLRETAAKLQSYSEWLLGRELLSQAVANPERLQMKRRTRAMLFLDLRGFTAWSEDRPPEAVVSMLNRCFEQAESLWEPYGPIKAKFTGDEIMLVFRTAEESLACARDLSDSLGRFLVEEGLGCGIGLHIGPLVEGLVGSREVKGYDVIGDTVNTAKRICDQAAADEILASPAFLRALGLCEAGTPRLLHLKGKSEPFVVYSIEQAVEMPAGMSGRAGA
jgi:adenylate cyclase